MTAEAVHYGSNAAAMSSYHLPFRHSAAAAAPHVMSSSNHRGSSMGGGVGGGGGGGGGGAAVGGGSIGGGAGGDEVGMHPMAGMMDGQSYMANVEHFLNIPEICPTGGYRNSRYYMGTTSPYNGSAAAADACRMDAALQHHQHHRNHADIRSMGRASFYPNMNMNMNMAGMRFGDGMDAQVLGSNCLPQQGRPDSMSPCTKAVGMAGDPDAPSFYPWMSIVGKYPFSINFINTFRPILMQRLLKCKFHLNGWTTCGHSGRDTAQGVAFQF